MRASILIGMALLASPVAAKAQAQLHDKVFYMQNDSLREATLSWCHADERRGHLWDCRNAEAAGNVKLLRERPSDPLKDPQFWRENPVARAGILRICAHPQEADRPYLAYCRYAASGIGQ